MITRYRISLNGKHLDSLDSNICILDIQHTPPQYSMTIETPANKDGGIITKKYKEKATVTVIFELHIYDTKTRNTVCQTIKNWANAGGTLKTNERQGKILQHCVCEQLPDIESVRDWTKPLTVVFSAYQFPYWETETPTTLTLTGTNTSGTLKLPGDKGETDVSVSISVTQRIEWFTITSGSTGIRVNTTIPANSTVTIDSDTGYLRIRNGGQSLLKFRTGQSSDFLRANTGGNTKITLQASAKVTATVSARGAWL